MNSAVERAPAAQRLHQCVVQMVVSGRQGLCFAAAMMDDPLAPSQTPMLGAPDIVSACLSHLAGVCVDAARGRMGCAVPFVMWYLVHLSHMPEYGLTVGRRRLQRGIGA
jgi:hypothetical protein